MPSVVKANYVRVAGGGMRRIRASVRYLSRRPDREGERGERTGFDKEGSGLERPAIQERLDRAEREGATHLYRFILSPDAEADTPHDLRRYTRETMQALEVAHRGRLAWVAVEHAKEGGHSDRAHVHVVAATHRKLDRDELSLLREAGTQAWERQLELQRTLERDPLA